MIRFLKSLPPSYRDSHEWNEFVEGCLHGISVTAVLDTELRSLIAFAFNFNAVIRAFKLNYHKYKNLIVAMSDKFIFLEKEIQ